MVMYIFPFRARVVCRVIISLGRVRTKLLHVTFTGKFFVSIPRTPAGPAYTQMQIQHRWEGPWTPLHQPNLNHGQDTSAVLDSHCSRYLWSNGSGGAGLRAGGKSD